MHDPSGLRFLIAAKQGEMAELGELTRTVDLVMAVSGLVHQLQRERGLSNLYLASAGQRFSAEQSAQRQATGTALSLADEQLQRIEPAQMLTLPAGQGSRLYARIAQALQAQAAVPALRAAIDALAMDALRATRAYVRVVDAWLGVVFEAADIAADADVSCRLVSLFHLMQAKELAGRERAAGSARFAAGRVQADDQLRLQDLIDAQERSIDGFEHFAPEPVRLAWQAAQAHPGTPARQRLRRWLLAPSDHGALNPELSMEWFTACSACMDGMKAVEDALLADLRHLCGSKCATLEHDISALLRLAAGSDPHPGVMTSEQALALLETPEPRSALPEPGHAMAPELPAQAARHVAALVQSQARRLGEVTADLDAARAALQERKLIERAKGVLMAQAALTEDDAFHALRRMAMAQGRKVAEVAMDLLRRTT